MKIRRGLSSRIIAAAFLALLSLIVALPLYWTFTIAFRPNADLFMHRVVPSGFTIEHFEALIFFKEWAGFESVSFLVPLANSLLVALGATAISLIISIFAGYSLARIPFRGKKLISSYILLAYIFPPFILILSLYSFLHTVGLHNTLGGLILLHLIIVVPYCTWALRGFSWAFQRKLRKLPW
jgi:ABC-type sugar transport system, permease component